MALGLPSVDMVFKQLGTSAVQRGERGIVGLIVRDTEQLIKTIYDITDLPDTLTEVNQKYIKDALIGYTNAPLRVELYVLSTDEEVVNALNYFELTKFDYLAFPSATTQEYSDISLWIKSMRDNEDLGVKTVLPETVADYEGIINFTQNGITTEEAVYSSSEYISRIAGLICGTDLKISCTYAPLSEVLDLPYESRNDTSSRISNGELVLFKEDRKVKIGRGITSLTTTNGVKGDYFKKIKIVDIMDLIKSDLKTTIKNNYIGKYPNSYNNKCLLITSIEGYLEGLYLDGLIDVDYIVSIDLNKQKQYLKSNGINVNEMTEEEIKVANTKDKVFIKISIKILDAIEDVFIDILI